MMIMRKIKNKNIEKHFIKIIEFADTFEKEESKSLIFRVLNYIGEFEKNIIDERINYSSELGSIIIEKTGGGLITLVSGILFSFIKKDEFNEETIKENFGESVAKILIGLYKIPVFTTKKIDSQSENLIKFLLTITNDVRAILVILATELYNIRHIDGFNEEEKNRIINRIKMLYTPLAHRIGLYNIKTEFEETVMKHTEVEMYRFIAKKLQETKASRDKYINDFITPLKKMISEAGFTASIKGRPKSIHSIWNKMKSQGVPFEEVYDLFAIRIILKSDLKNEKAVCWNVYSLITDLYKPNPKRLRDWISAPKLSGYESLHTTVLGFDNKWVEVQIRTERMDEVAEKGPAAHWRYKTGKEGGKNDWLAKIREEIENPVDDENTNKSKSALYSDEILVFTPEGDLKSLKKGYTIIDFAYAIHTRVGETCSGAVVNGNIQPLSYELKNGDTVKILTNKNKKPNAEWLKIAKGTRTKNKIKRALKEIQFDKAEAGKEIIKDKLERIKIGFSEKNIEKLTEYFNFKTAVELYHNIGKGNIDISKIKQVFEKTENKKENIKELKEQIFSEVLSNDANSSNDFLLIGNNISNLDYSLATCCNPLPGDKIFGFISVNKGTRIHKKSCTNAKDMISRFPYRVIDAKWNTENINSTFSAKLFISGKDTPGIATKITELITKEFKLNLQAISLRMLNDNIFEGEIVVKINNKEQLLELNKKLKTFKNIKQVYLK